MPLADVQFVYRAARGAQWIDQARRIIQPQAFIRRPGRDNGGLSVALTPEGAAAFLKKAHGMIQICAKSLSDRGFYLEEGDDGHLNICGVPFDEPANKDLVFAKAQELVYTTNQYRDGRTHG